ncbi:MAG: hypothetical protein KBT13_07200 [Bacteroidales bacterium]|uniref:hypothetical protein n=1 Tax=Sodaliphilus sp. TaxID=2815818 RepID=UPI001B64958C|nr:hypothetical protein [Candidatus Sodaliphilus limicaballi]
MNNETENFVPEIDTTVVLEPSMAQATPKSEPLETQLENACQRMGIAPESRPRILDVLQSLNVAAPTDEAVQMLDLALRHDEDVKNADAQGYLRGRNENIDASIHPEQHQEDTEAAQRTFPRYTRRSVWD